MDNEHILTEDWNAYERCRDYLSSRGFYTNVDKCFRFVEGKQWSNDAPDGMPKPQVNVLKPIVDYKVSTVLRNGMNIHFSNAEFEDGAVAEFTERICEHINKHVLKVWERNKMDLHMWELARDACICGGSAIYSYWDGEQIKVELKSNTDILFADEQERDVQKQQFVIIPFRRNVVDVRREAKANGIAQEEIEKIISDEDTEYQAGAASKREIDKDGDKDTDGKCLCLLKLWKDEKNGHVFMRKSTKMAVYCKDTDTKLNEYPVAFLPWNVEKGGLRGKGDVLEWIPNQIEINVGLARIAVAVMQNAYPKLAYSRDFIDNAEELNTVGACIGVDGAIDSVQKAISYITPQPISPDARSYISDLMEQTQNFGGRDVTTNINPEQASGKAILAVQEASAIPLNMQVARVKEFMEDIGRVWWDIYCATAENGLPISYDTKEQIAVLDSSGQPMVDESGQPITQEIDTVKVEYIPQDVLVKIKLNAKVDVTSTSTYSKYAVEASLDNLLSSGLLSLEEYTKALPDGSVMPKTKLEEVVKDRAEHERQLQALSNERDQYKMAFEQTQADYKELSGALQTYEQVGRQILQGQNAQMREDKKVADVPNAETNKMPTA